jgi:hypothetical protein
MPGHDARHYSALKGGKASSGASLLAAREFTEREVAKASAKAKAAKVVDLASAKPGNYQHVRAQTTEEANGHAATRSGRALKCAICEKPIKRVEENAGPEGLAAMFRF